MILHTKRVNLKVMYVKRLLHKCEILINHLNDNYPHAKMKWYWCFFEINNKIFGWMLLGSKNRDFLFLTKIIISVLKLSF